MAYALISNTIAGATTTSGIDTTGADLLVVAIASTTTPTVSDSKGNTWNSLTFTSKVRLFWSRPSTVGSGHTFTVGNGDGFHSIGAAAFSGSAASPFDQETGAAGVVQPGSITPSEDNELLVTALNDTDAGTQTVDSGFTISDQLGQGGTYGLALAYLIQTAAAAKNPAWSPGNNGRVVMAAFKAAAGGGGGGSTVGADAMHHYREHVMRSIA